MISPKELHDLIVKLLVIILSIAGVDDEIIVLAVFLFHEPSDVVDGVAVSLLQA